MFIQCQTISLFDNGSSIDGVCMCCLAFTLSIPSSRLGKGSKVCSEICLSDYSYHSSVSSMLEQLNWLPLAKRRKQQKLNLFYQIMNGEIGLSLPDYYHFTNNHTKQHHPFHLIISPINTTSYMTSYFPRTIREWNLLPPPLITVNSLAVFSNQLTEHL